MKLHVGLRGLGPSRASPAEYGAGLKLAIERGWLWLHESGTYVKLTDARAALFARPHAPDAMIAAADRQATLTARQAIASVRKITLPRRLTGDLRTRVEKLCPIRIRASRARP
jgi:hypothetical protein